MKLQHIVLGLGFLLLSLIVQPVLSQEIPFTARERLALSQSVVMIITSQDSQGSGVLVSTTGVIWTNAHVVEDDDDQIVDIWMYNGEDHPPEFTYRAEVTELDRLVDFAQLQIMENARGRAVTSSSLRLSAIQYTSSAVSQGDSIYLFGYPAIAENFLNITSGIVTSIPSRSYGQVYYSDAEFAPGGSGGPVINANGQMIGIAAEDRPDSSGRLVEIIPVPTICSNLPSMCDSAPVPTQQSPSAAAFNTNLGGWTIRGDGGNWNVTRQGLEGTVPSGTDSFYVSNNTFANLAYDTNFIITAGYSTASAGVIFRSRAEPLQGSYMIRVSVYNGGEISLVKFFPTRQYQQLARNNIPIALNTSYTLRVVAVGSEISAYLNNQLVLHTYDDSFAAGVVGLNINSSTTIFYSANTQPN